MPTEEETKKINEAIASTNQGIRGVEERFGTDLTELSELTNEPTIGDSFGDLLGSEDATDRYLQERAARLPEQRPIDEDKIRRDVLQRYQKEIDAANEIYAQKLAEAKQEGIGRLGSTRAVQARSGLLGSDFAGAQDQKVTDFNRSITDTVRAEKAAKIAEIMGFARQGAAEEIAAKRAAQQAGYQEYIDYLKTKTERNQERLANLGVALVSRGIDPNELSQKELKQIADSYGASVVDVIAAYQNSLPEEQSADTEGFTLSEGQARYVLNPATGQYEVVGARDKTYKPTGGTGTGVDGSTVINEFGNPITQSTPKYKPTGAERQALTYFSRMKDAIGNLDSLEDEVTNLGLLGQVNLNAGNSLTQDSTLEKISQAQRAFTEARLRKDSGAAIPPEEFRNDRKTYFPQPGDSEEVLKQKAISRQVALDAVRLEAGNAYWEYFGEPPTAVGQRILQGQETDDNQANEQLVVRDDGTEIIIVD